MANTFRVQAEDRFKRSLAFMSKAEALLQDDLVNRSALADAVSAIKNMLQGYLLLRVSQTPQSAVTQRWQEVASSNSMPDLIQCCGEAGLNLAGLAGEIKQLNTRRNRRMHDDPSQRIDTQQAKTALELTRVVQQRIKAAIQGKPVVEPSAQPAAVQRIAAVTRAAVSGRLGRDLLRSVTSPSGVPRTEPTVSLEQAAVATAPTQDPLPSTSTGSTSVSGSLLPLQSADERADEALLPPPETPAIEAGEAPVAEMPERTGLPEQPEAISADALADDIAEETVDVTDPIDDGDGDGDSSDNSDETTADGDGDMEGSADTAEMEVVVPVRRSRRRRLGVALLRGLAAAVLLIVGLVAGAGLTFAVVEGHPPASLAFATSFLPATPVATPSALVATATPAPQSGPLFAGAFMVDEPACAGSGMMTLSLHNAATVPARWTAGSPDGIGVVFAPASGGAGAPTLAGTLQPAGTITLYVTQADSAPYHVVVVAPDGAVQLLAPTC